VIVIGDLMGFAPEDRPALLRCADLANAAGAGPGMRHWTKDTLGAIADFHAALMRVIEARRKNPQTDLVSLLATTEFAGETLTDTEIFNEALLLNDGGADTTRYVITGGMKALIEHPEQRAKLVADPSLIPLAVEECLRWVTPIVNMARTATTDVDIRGTTIKQDDWVVLLYGAANRDAEVFPEPERFDITRGGRHVAFGFGTHFCLGAHLARLEVRVMFEELLKRMPDLELAGAVHTSPTAFVRGIDRMPVRFSPAAKTSAA
jgi:cytochrome P450 family 142 subfamily A polypeptide 1